MPERPLARAGVCTHPVLFIRYSLELVIHLTTPPNPFEPLFLSLYLPPDFFNGKEGRIPPRELIAIAHESSRTALIAANRRG